MKRLLLMSVLVAGACSHEPKTITTPDAKGSQPPAARPDGGSPLSAGPSQDKPPAIDPTAVTAAKPPAKIKIFIRTSPSKMFVHWGKKNLGLTPLTVERPRDSGPVDLVLRGSGYFPMHTRAYTVKNDTISVKMVKLADRMTVFGAKAEVPETPDPLDPATAVPAPAAPAAPAP